MVSKYSLQLKKCTGLNTTAAIHRSWFNLRDVTVCVCHNELKACFLSLLIVRKVRSSAYLVPWLTRSCKTLKKTWSLWVILWRRLIFMHIYPDAGHELNICYRTGPSPPPTRHNRNWSEMFSESQLVWNGSCSRTYHLGLFWKGPVTFLGKNVCSWLYNSNNKISNVTKLKKHAGLFSVLEILPAPKTLASG